MHRRSGWMACTCAVLCAALAICAAPAVSAQQHGAAAAPQPGQGVRDPAAALDPLQPDFNLAALPTTLRMPRGKWAFRVTHRFTRSLGQGDFADAASNLFGLDGGARIGLEIRVGVATGTQVGIHRTSDRSIQLFLQQNLMDERQGASLGFDVLATLEGEDNLSEHHQAAFGAVVSKQVRRRATLYVTPVVVFNAGPFEDDEQHTLLTGIGGRLRLGRSTYLMGEYVPRLAGFSRFADQITAAIESRAGGHLFQINVGNGFGTTLGQLARGGVDYDQWFLGFSISRKFF